MASRTALPLFVAALFLGAGALWWISEGGSTRGGPRSGGPEVQVGPATTGGVADPEAPLAAPTGVGAVGTPAAGRREVGAAALPDESGAQEEMGEGGVRMEGAVLDPLGAPVEGASVLAVPGDGFLSGFAMGAALGNGQEATTDSAGHFTLEGLKAGRLGLRVRAEGYAPYERRDLVLPTDEVFRMPPILLEAGAIVSGIVLDARGNPVPGAELRRLDPDDPMSFFAAARVDPLTVAGDDGRFRADTLALGKWVLTVHSEDHPDARFQGVTEQAGREVSGLEFVLPDGEEIAGRGISLPAGVWRELEVTATRVGATWSEYDQRSALLAQDGSFRLRGLVPNSEYELRLGLSSDNLFAFESHHRSAPISAYSGTEGVEIPYQVDGALLFRVVDAATLQPIEDFEVRAGIDWTAPLKNEDGSIAKHHPGGRVRFGDLRPSDPGDRAQLSVRATGYRDLERASIALLSGQELDLGELLMEPVPVVRVTVLDLSSMLPIPGASVQLRRQDGEGDSMEFSMGDDGPSWSRGGMSTAVTDAEGVATLSSFEGETVTLHVEAPDHATFEEANLGLPLGDSVDRTVTLGIGGEVVVIVRDPDGKPAGGARVLHTGPGEADPGFGNPFGGEGSITDSEGRVTFSHLTPGRHQFRVSDGNESGMFMSMGGAAIITAAMGRDEESKVHWDPIEVSEGASLRLILMAKARGTLLGRVFEAGRPLTGASVKLEDPDSPVMPGMSWMGGGGGGVRTGGDGGFTIENVVVGTYGIVIEHPTRSMPARFEVEVRPGENSFDADLDVTRIEGRITTPEGDPIAGLSVRAERHRDGEQGVSRTAFVMTGGDGGTVGGMFNLGEASAGGTTDADGRYSLRGVLADTPVVVLAKGHGVQEDQSEPVEVSSGETKSGVNLVLLPAGSLRVEAFEPEGTAADFRIVRARMVGNEDDGQARYGMTNDEGIANFQGLEPGTWEVWGTDHQEPDSKISLQEIEVLAGMEGEVVLQLPANQR